MFAVDIDACAKCGFLYFPGDDLEQTPEGAAHLECVRPPRFAVLK